MSILWVALGCLALWFVVTSPRFRKILLAIGIVAALAGGFWLLPEGPASERSEALKFATPQPVSYAEQMEIPADELVLRDVFVQRPAPYEKHYKISGVIENKSGKTLAGVRMQVTVSDCRSQPRCRVVGENVIRIKTGLPPGQTKDFGYTLTQLRGLPLGESLSWSWVVTASYAD
jgi:hypothetical protein